MIIIIIVIIIVIIIIIIIIIIVIIIIIIIIIISTHTQLHNYISTKTNNLAAPKIKRSLQIIITKLVAGHPK